MSEMTWLGITKDELANQLRHRFDVQELSVPRLTETFSQLEGLLRDGFLNYWNDGTVQDDLSVENWNMKRLMTERQMHPIGAFGALSWLLRDPSAAKKALSSHLSMMDV